MVEKGVLVKNIFNFWQKYDFFKLLKKVSLTVAVLSFIFLVFYIPIKDESIGPLFGIINFLLCFLCFCILMDKNKEKAAKTFIFFSAVIFSYSYFLINRSITAFF